MAFWHYGRKLDLILSTVRGIEAQLIALNAKENRTMALLDALTAEVANNTNVEASVVTLINGLAAQIASNTADPAALAALVTQLKNNDAALAAAVAQNTPAPPAPAA